MSDFPTVPPGEVALSAEQAAAAWALLFRMGALDVDDPAAVAALLADAQAWAAQYEKGTP